MAGKTATPRHDDQLISLSHREEAWILAEPVWAESLVGGAACKRCLVVDRRRLSGPLDVVVDQLLPSHTLGTLVGKVALGGIFRGKTVIVCGIIRHDVRETLAHLMTDCVFGRCFWPDGSPVETHASFYLKDMVHCRQPVFESWQLCPWCGTSWPGAGCRGNSYLVIPPSDRRTVYQDAQFSTFFWRRDLDALGILNRKREFFGGRYIVYQRPPPGAPLLPGDPPDHDGPPPEPFTFPGVKLDSP